MPPLERRSAQFAPPQAAPVSKGLSQNILKVVGGHVSADVQAVIAKALKSAGLT